MPRENISALTAVTVPADGDQIQVRDASAPASNKSITLAVLRQAMTSGIVTITAASDAITKTEHGGKTIVLSRSGGIDLTLPEATGSGDKYEFVFGVATADAYTIAGDDANADFAGTIVGFDGDGEPANGWTDADATSLSFGGTSQARGGSIGDRVIVTDIAADLWAVSGIIAQGGTEATPFVA